MPKKPITLISNTEVLTVDPGLGGTGVAFWNVIPRGKLFPLMSPAHTECFNSKMAKNVSWQIRASDIANQFESYIKRFEPQEIVIEFQELWTGNQKSMASASAGHLFKLTYLTGMLGQISYEFLNHQPVLVTPNEWKGQLSKGAVHCRIKRAFGLDYDEHIADAVGMGLAIHGSP